MTSLKEWIDIKVKDRELNYFKYESFSNVEEIGRGAYGIVNRADWNDGGKVALKKINNLKIDNKQKENFFRELKLLQVNARPNINQFIGVTKDLAHDDDYIIVLQYANQGNLREYLENKFSALQWKDKIQMALDITCGLKYLHYSQIIHRNLHSKNILANNGTLMIGDLGLSKQFSEIATDSTHLGMPAYIDPQCFKTNNYKRNEKSDIYSLGVLFWEISSGKPPFYEVNSGKTICDVFKGVREKPIKNTPSEYQQLYENCWKEEPDQRPGLDEVYRVLNLLKTQFNNEVGILQNLSDLDFNNQSSSAPDNDQDVHNISKELNLNKTEMDGNRKIKFGWNLMQSQQQQQQQEMHQQQQQSQLHHQQQQQQLQHHNHQQKNLLQPQMQHLHSQVIQHNQQHHQEQPPKRPMNAFILFSSERRPELQKNDQNMQTAQVSKILGEEWKSMDGERKEHYLERARQLKEEFRQRNPNFVYTRRGVNSTPQRNLNNNVLSSQTNAPSTTPTSNSPRAPQNNINRQQQSQPQAQSENALLIFNEEMRPKVLKTNPNMTVAEISKTIGESWRGMTDDEREVYLEKARNLCEFHESNPDFSRSKAELAAAGHHSYSKKRNFGQVEDSDEDGGDHQRAPHGNHPEGAPTGSPVKDPRGHKKKRNRHPPPKHPMSAFLFYALEMRPHVAEQNPVGPISKIIASNWRNLSPEAREEWEEQAADDKARYAREMEVYLQAQKDEE